MKIVLEVDRLEDISFELKKHIIEEFPTKENLIEFSKDRDKHVRELVASHSQIPSEVFDHLVNDSQWEILYHLVKNPKTSSKYLEQIYYSGLSRYGEEAFKIIRVGMIGNPNVPLFILEETAEHETNLEMLSELLANENSSSDLLDKLARERKEEDICYYLIAKHKNTSLETLEYLASKDCYYTKLNLCENPKTPKTALITFSKDDNSYIREIALKRLLDLSGFLKEDG